MRDIRILFCFFALSWNFGSAPSIQIDEKHMLLTMRAECMHKSAYVEMQITNSVRANENAIEGCELHSPPKEPFTLEIRLCFPYRKRPNPKKKKKNK